jgi:hypothetical protein
MSNGSQGWGPLSRTEPRLAGLINENVTEKPASWPDRPPWAEHRRSRPDLKIGLARRAAAQQHMWHAVRRRQGSGRPATDPAHQVVVQVLSYPRSIDENVDADLAQMPGRPDAGQHEQMRGADGARAHHHLAIHFGPMNDVPDGVVGAAALAINIGPTDPRTRPSRPTAVSLLRRNGSSA